MGKTALARTLLRRDVGEVADRAHVTVVAEAHTMIEAENCVMRLWDTPGFGAALAKLVGRLRASENPLGWLLHQVWDRVTDKSLWCSQEAIRNIREDADVVLYLVDASVEPESAGYVNLEMEVLSWIGKPVLVLLNQTGEPKPDRDAAEISAWRDHLSRWETVKHVLALDAFARCWVQERELLDLVHDVLEEDKQAACQMLVRTWRQRNLQAFLDSGEVIGRWLAGSLSDTETVSEPTVLERLGMNRSERNRELDRARSALCENLADRTKTAINELIRLHGLEGDAERKLSDAAKTQFTENQSASEVFWGVLGGAASGALTGLGADLLSGGLTLGGGLIAGAAAGGAGGYALAKGYNLARGEKNTVRWSERYFLDLVQLALKSYLAVAHFGRGRGAWRESEHPAFWDTRIQEVVDSRKEELEKIWKQRSVESLEGHLRKMLRILLIELYPETKVFD